ncbi:MAG: hypothetical protein HY906_27570 [Deltaproteobacteria bacterium]|nr:hypothetical protein [Deltaproteobacteria bacterium]
MRRSTVWVACAMLLGAACGGRPAGPFGDHDGGAPPDGIGADVAATDGAPRPDGGSPDVLQRDGAPPDGGGYYGIPCGWGICVAGEEFCCVSGSAPVQECVAVDVVGPHCDFGARCDGPEDCGYNQQCCMPSGAIMQTYCVAGSCPAGRALCHSNADCTRAGESCCFSMEFGWDHWTCLPGPQCPST